MENEKNPLTPKQAPDETGSVDVNIKIEDGLKVGGSTKKGPETGKTETSSEKPLNYMNLVLGFALVLVIVFIGLYVNSCSSNKDLAKQVIEAGKSLETTNATVKKLQEEVVKNAAELRELDAAFQDSLDKANNPEWLRVADSLAFEYSQKKEKERVK